MFKRIDHVEIVVKDLEKTIEFYRDMLGFTLKMRHLMSAPPMKEIVYMELGDTMIELMSIEEPKPKSEQAWQVGYRMLALEVVNMDEAVEFLKRKGVEISWGPVDLGRSKRAEILDPNGLGIELRQW